MTEREYRVTGSPTSGYYSGTLGVVTDEAEAERRLASEIDRATRDALMSQLQRARHIAGVHIEERDVTAWRLHGTGRDVSRETSLLDLWDGAEAAQDDVRLVWPELADALDAAALAR